jgi:hypothetical protein
MSLDYAVRADPEADAVVRFSDNCPIHGGGDDSQLAYRRDGWPGAVCAAPKKFGHKKCVPQYRLTILCEVLLQECWCEKELPANLRGLISHEKSK